MRFAFIANIFNLFGHRFLSSHSKSCHLDAWADAIHALATLHTHFRESEGRRVRYYMLHATCYGPIRFLYICEKLGETSRSALLHFYIFKMNTHTKCNAEQTLLALQFVGWLHAAFCYTCILSRYEKKKAIVVEL